MRELQGFERVERLGVRQVAAVLDQHQLQLRMRLGAGGTDRVREILGSVPREDDDGDGGHGAPRSFSRAEEGARRGALP